MPARPAGTFQLAAGPWEAAPIRDQLEAYGRELRTGAPAGLPHLAALGALALARAADPGTPDQLLCVQRSSFMKRMDQIWSNFDGFH